MPTQYLVVKFLHIFIAVVALGTSAGLGIVLEFYGAHPSHGSFVLRAISRILLFVVVPGYILMLGTGVWLVGLSWSFTVKWILFALVLWSLGTLPLLASLLLLGKQRVRLDATGPTSAAFRRVSVLARAVGGLFGGVVALITYLMVVKPWS